MRQPVRASVLPAIGRPFSDRVYSSRTVDGADQAVSAGQGIRVNLRFASGDATHTDPLKFPVPSDHNEGKVFDRQPVAYRI